MQGDAVRRDTSYQSLLQAHYRRHGAQPAVVTGSILACTRLPEGKMTSTHTNCA